LELEGANKLPEAQGGLDGFFQSPWQFAPQTFFEIVMHSGLELSKRQFQMLLIPSRQQLFDLLLQLLGEFGLDITRVQVGHELIPELLAFEHMAKVVGVNAFVKNIGLFDVLVEICWIVVGVDRNSFLLANFAEEVLVEIMEVVRRTCDYFSEALSHALHNPFKYEFYIFFLSLRGILAIDFGDSVHQLLNEMLIAVEADGRVKLPLEDVLEDEEVKRGERIDVRLKGINLFEYFYEQSVQAFEVFDFFGIEDRSLLL